MGIREKADDYFSKEYPNGNKAPFQNHNYKAFLKGAKWALEKAAKEADNDASDTKNFSGASCRNFKQVAIKIRQLSKELEG